METTAAKRMKLLNRKSNEVSAAADDHNVEADRISDLPYEIVHHIFSFLPIKYVAQTCVLSKRWKHIWYTYPCLDFTDSSTFFNNHRSGNIEHVVSVLEKRHSDVKILRFRGRSSHSGLVRLMEEAVRHNVEELDLKFTGYAINNFAFNLPRCITNSLSLRDLRFASWFDNIRLPPLDAMKNGFKSLESLSLSRVYLDDQPSVLNLFTDSCSFPSLTKLDLHSLGLKCLRIQMAGLREITVRGCSIMQELEISAENLRKLSLETSFPSRCPVSTRVKIDAPMLEIITWSPYDVTDECVIGKFDSLNEAVVGLSLFKVDYRDSTMSGASNFLAGISQCQSLTLDESIIGIISRFSHLPAAKGVQLCVFGRLKSLKVTGLGRHNTSGLASLFRCSPACSSIEISVVQWKEDLQELPHFVDDIYDWESQAKSTSSFLRHLKQVKIFGLSKTAIGLVRFLLKHGESLQRFSISDLLTIDSNVEDMIKSRIRGFPRASSTVHIIF